MTATRPDIIVTFMRTVPDTIHVEDIPAAIKVLDEAMGNLQDAVTLVADDRARWIAHLAGSMSVRAAAEALGMSPAAVSKAVARAELTSQLTGHPAGAPSTPTPNNVRPIR